MCDLRISISAAFDGAAFPVLLLCGARAVYRNPAAAALLAVCGAEGDVPDCLLGLPEQGISALTLGGRSWTARTWPGEGGVFLSLTPLDEGGILPDRRVPLLTQRLRGPLAVLLSSGRLLERAVSPDRADLAADCMARMVKSELRLLRMLRTMELAALPDGEPPYDFDPHVTDLGGLLHEAMRQLAYPVRSTGCTISLCEAPGNYYVRCDDQLLLVQLYHLVSNAIAALAPDGGTISLRLERRGTLALITVEDDGPGLDGTQLAALFRPAEGNETLAGALHGLGLGVTVCRKIAQLHGGSVLFSARPGGGTRACVSIPLVQPGPAVELHRARAADTANGVPLVLRELSDVLPERLFRPEE